MTHIRWRSIENSDQFIFLKRIDPTIEIEIEKKTSLIKINIKNHISNLDVQKLCF